MDNNDKKFKSKIKVIEAKLSSIKDTNVPKLGNISNGKVFRVHYSLDDLKRDVRNEKLVQKGQRINRAKEYQKTSLARNSKI